MRASQKPIPCPTEMLTDTDSDCPPITDIADGAEKSERIISPEPIMLTSFLNCSSCFKKLKTSIAARHITKIYPHAPPSVIKLMPFTVSEASPLEPAAVARQPK